jgi:drug/metabolite transporter (DMT)-like permease
MGWEYLIVLVVSALISVALAPKPPNQKPADLADIDAPTAEEGKPIPVVFGTVMLSGPNVLWYGALRTTPIKADSGK